MTEQNPFEALGGEPGVRALAAAFYDAMDAHEPALARLHPLDAEGRVAEVARERFALFFIGWLGGPQDYVAQHGHPRLRMRHARVPIDPAMRDAWMRAMRRAFDDRGLDGPLRSFLEERLEALATHLQNR